VTRPDLADRALFLHLAPIPEADRKSERELQTALDSEKPRLLGALVDAVAHGLKRLPNTHLAEKPRWLILQFGPRLGRLSRAPS